MKTRISWIFYCLVSFMLLPSLSAAERFVTNESNGFTWIQQGKAYPILVDSQEDKGVLRAVANLQLPPLIMTILLIFYTPGDWKAFMMNGLHLLPTA